MRNITVSAWNSRSISLVPQNCDGSGWVVNFKDGGGGRYRSCTLSAETPSASLMFQGSAVYYISTYFNNQTIEFSLDGATPAFAQLTPPSGIFANSNISKVMWYVEGLQEAEHSLQIIPANNDSTLSVDTIVYTTNQTVESPSSLSSFPSLPSAPAPIPVTSIPTPLGAIVTRAVLDNQTIGFIFGVTAGSISGLILIALLVMMWFRKRDLTFRRRYRSLSEGTVQSSLRFNNSIQQRTQRSHLTVFSTEEIPVSKSPEPVRPLALPQRAGSSAGRRLAETPHMERENREEHAGYSEAMDKRNQRTANQSASPYGSNYPKLEPLRKSTFQT